MEKSTGGKLSVKIFWLWLSFAAVVTIACGLAYLLVQQDIRQSANYPQSQMAEDAVTANDSTSLAGPASVDISTSLAPFLSTFDANGNVIRSNAILNGSTPVPPHGVFGYAQTHGEDRFTWQPQTGVRVAAVLVWHPGNEGRNAGMSGNVSGAGFFALSGRSLRDVEILESRLTVDAFFVWIAALAVMFILSICTAKVFSEKKSRENGNEKQDNPPTIQTP